jgi:hypothetical protein
MHHELLTRHRLLADVIAKDALLLLAVCREGRIGLDLRDPLPRGWGLHEFGLPLVRWPATQGDLI